MSDEEVGKLAEEYCRGDHGVCCSDCAYTGFTAGGLAIKAHYEANIIAKTTQLMVYESKIAALEKQVEGQCVDFSKLLNDANDHNNRLIQYRDELKERVAELEAMVDAWVPSASRELYYGERFSSDYTKMKLENERLEAEVSEQCRLNGMGSEREARLMARVSELEKLRAASLGVLQWMKGFQYHKKFPAFVEALKQDSA